VRALAPRRLKVEGRFNVRGGITTRVVARYRREPAPLSVAGGTSGQRAR
jgi:NADPH-dependent 7-cyano-7-deazaguanine reductase QueF